jgi:hypothetical protein
VASMSVATGIPPNELLACEPAIYSAIRALLIEQGQSRKTMGVKRRR